MFTDNICVALEGIMAGNTRVRVKLRRGVLEPRRWLREDVSVVSGLPRSSLEIEDEVAVDTKRGTRIAAKFNI